MYYVLNSNVYLVNGKSKSCIYDLNKSKLYSINKVLAEKLEMVNNGLLIKNTVDEELKKVFDKFSELEIMRLSESIETHYIQEIKRNDSVCKFAWIEITNKCNMKCLHCYNDSHLQRDNIMSLEDFKLVVDNLISLKIRSIQIIGGEPFYDKDNLKNMLNYVIGKFDFIEIFTNGTLIPDIWFEYLKKNYIHIALSIYSYDADMHDKVTGAIGSFEKTSITIEKLKKYDIPYRVCNVLIKNIDIGTKNNHLYTLRDDKDIVRMSGRASLSLLSDELIKKKLITKKTFAEPLKKSFCSRLVSGHNCFNDKIYISANLEVFPCVMERRIKHCMIKENNKITLDDNIRFFVKDKINECSECEYRYACFDCRPNSLSNNILEKPWYCTYSPLNGEWENEDEFILKLRKKWD